MQRPFVNKSKKESKKKKQTLQLWSKVIVGVIPCAIIGLLLDNIIEDYLSKNIVIAITLIVYGIVFIFVEKHPKKEKVQTIERLDYKSALKIGCFQCLALIPGTSRSGATILGGLYCGCSRTVASEFSFFLAIPVMFGASLLKLVKFGFHFTGEEAAILIIGMIVAFVVSLIVIKFLMGYIKKHNFIVFGWYSIVLGAIVLLCGIAGLL